MTRSPRRKNRGVTLIMVVIFLVLITLLSISVFRASSTNARLTSNMAGRQGALAAAQAGIEQAISTKDFQDNAIVSTTTVQVDVDGDGTADYTANVTPAAACSKVRTIPNAELPKDSTTGLPTAKWVRCDSGSTGRAVGGGAGSSGLIEGGTAGGAGATGNSFCVETVWNVQATVTDNRTGASVEVNQGVGVPYGSGEAQDRCTRNYGPTSP